MKKHQGLFFTAGLMIFLLLSVNVFAQSDGKPPAQLPEKLEKFTFPTVEGWTKSEMGTDPALGFGEIVHYDSPTGGRVTVYFYPNAVKGETVDDRKAILKDQLLQTKGGIQALGEMGIYEDITDANDDEIMLGGSKGTISTNHSTLSFKVKGKQMTSEIFVFIRKDDFVKIRSTRPKSSEPDSSVAQLYSTLDSLFAK